MDGGEVKEFDHPFTLMQDTSGFFYEMVQQTGKAHAEILLKSARTSYEEKDERQKVEWQAKTGTAKQEKTKWMDGCYDEDSKSLLSDSEH